MIPGDVAPKVNPQKNERLEQFLKDVNKLQDHYLLALKPTISITENGIVPMLKVVDKTPKPFEVPEVETKPTDVLTSPEKVETPKLTKEVQEEVAEPIKEEK